MIQVFQPTLGAEEQAAAAAALASGWVGFGPKVREFEQAWATHLGVPAEHVVSVSCATEGLYQIFAQISGGSVWVEHNVIIPAISFIGIANAIRDASLGVVLCDVDRHTLNPTVDHIRGHMGDDTRAVCIQHYGGVPSDLGPIAELCRERGKLLVEDCACAPLSYYAGQRAGTVGDFAVWSFDSMKIITSAGEGGMVYCKDAGAAEQIRQATRLGQDQLSGQSGSGPRWWEFKVAEPGRKAMMNDVQAAVGLVQLRKLEQLVVERGLLAHQYVYRMAHWDTLGIYPVPSEPSTSSFYSFWIQCERRDELAAFLRAREIYTTFRYWPVHRAYGWQGTWPGADWAADHTLNLPLHANLTRANVQYICDTIQEFWEKT